MTDAIDCQGFAGGLTLGVVRAGFRLVGKREHDGGFGAPACEANRHLLGDDWSTEACDAAEWTPYHVPFVFGNPPCSGFSLVSNKDFRGVDSKINSCMWDLFGFAARCHPEVVVMESVTQAFKIGRELMTGLRAKLEQDTGRAYHLTHVIQDNYSLGGCSVRQRYFMVAHAVPFGVDHHDLTYLPVWEDVISDLTECAPQWEPQLTQPFGLAKWANEHSRAAEGVVDGHVGLDNPGTRRVIEMIEGAGWEQGTNMDAAMKLYWEKHGAMPPGWATMPTYQRQLAAAPDFKFGFNQPKRPRWDRHPHVLTGAALAQVVHPTLPRMITHRETLRVLGFPDDWRIHSLQEQPNLGAYWGKGVSVQAGEWIAKWVMSSLQGAPGPVVGEEVGDRESLVDVSKDWRLLAKELKAKRDAVLA